MQTRRFPPLILAATESNNSPQSQTKGRGRRDMYLLYTVIEPDCRLKPVLSVVKQVQTGKCSISRNGQPIMSRQITEGGHCMNKRLKSDSCLLKSTIGYSQRKENICLILKSELIKNSEGNICSEL